MRLHDVFCVYSTLHAARNLKSRGDNLSTQCNCRRQTRVDLHRSGFSFQSSRGHALSVRLLGDVCQIDAHSWLAQDLHALKEEDKT